VIRRRGRPLGILTEHDLVSIVADGGAARPVAEVMTRDLARAAGARAGVRSGARNGGEAHPARAGARGETLIGVVSERDLLPSDWAWVS
jgi:CBS domain-containing protein